MALEDPRWRLEPGYRIDAFSEQDRIGPQAVVELWTREGAVEPEEAQRRVSEVLLIAAHRQDGLAGIASAYLQRNQQLRAELWHYRTFVATDHRQSNIAVGLAVMGRERLVDRWVTGEDKRGIGIIFEVENRGLQHAFPEAHWLPTDFLFIGENASGAHVRVHYFPGALAPEQSD